MFAKCFQHRHSWGIVECALDVEENTKCILSSIQCTLDSANQLV